MANTQYALHLKGFVGGADFDRNYVDYVLAQHVGKPVNVLIDSLGGSVATALSIASAFRKPKEPSLWFVKVINKSATLHRPWLTPYSNSFLQKLIFCIYLHHIHLIKPFYYEKNIIFS